MTQPNPDIPSTSLGVVQQLWRYPVKSMAGEPLHEVMVAFTGLMGDRVHAFTKDRAARPDFPWHTGREQPDLVTFVPRFVNPPSSQQPYPAADAFAVVVTTPAGEQLVLDDPRLLTAMRHATGYAISRRFSEKGMQDARPVSIMGLASMDALSTAAGRLVEARRLRANIYVHWHDPSPFYEDILVGRRLRIGERLELMIVKKNVRCQVINIDPDTGVSQAEVLGAVARQRQGCAGVYAAVLREGRIKTGDVITLVSA